MKTPSFCWIVSLTATLALGGTPVASAAMYEWDFTDGNLDANIGVGLLTYSGETEDLTTFGLTDGVTFPNIDGVPARYMSYPKWPDGPDDKALGYNLEFTASGPNGGGVYINQFTFIFDVYLPGAVDWTPFFNTNPENANDADWYVAPDGALGIGGLGYSVPGTIAGDTWYRLGFTADLGAGDVRYYVDGVKVHTRLGGSLLDGRFSLYSNVDPGPDVRLGNEGDTSGNYTHATVFSAVAFMDRTFTDADFAVLGGPKAAGIFPGSVFQKLQIQETDGLVVVTWTGAPNLQLQRATRLGPADWDDLTETLGESAWSEPIADGPAYFQLIAK